MQVQIDIPIAWQHIPEVRALVEKTLATHSEELSQAAVMTVSELIENAVKYGESVLEMPHVSLSLIVEPQNITISVANGIMDGESLKALQHHIDGINAAEDKQALYLQRFQELMEAPLSGGRLGLLRIAFEGQFDLSYRYVEPVLTVSAMRGIP